MEIETDLAHKVSQYFFIALGLFFPIGIVIAFIRLRAKKRAYAQSDDPSTPIEGTTAEREKSEEEMAKWSHDLRSELAKNYEIVGRLNTINGYSLSYVEDLLIELRSAGIAAEYNFQQTSPLGVGASMIERQGDYEIFVERAKVEEALPIIEKFRAR